MEFGELCINIDLWSVKGVMRILTLITLLSKQQEINQKCMRDKLVCALLLQVYELMLRFFILHIKLNLCINCIKLEALK